VTKVVDLYAGLSVDGERKAIQPTGTKQNTVKVIKFIKRNWDDINLIVQVTPAVIAMGLVVKFVIFAYSYTP
jgi:hypothetical protein